MLKPTVNTALNDQMNAEFYSAWLYLSMGAWCLGQNWQGFAHWLAEQAREEQWHAMKIFHYIDNREGTVTLAGIDAPNSDWVSLHTVFSAALAHEQEVTNNIGELVKLAQQEDDRATVVFLDWFVREQVEEEKQTNDILRSIATFDNMPGPLYQLDLELEKRPTECHCGCCRETECE